jgi:hypothetical protein
VFRIGIVGHRYLANKETIAFVREQCGVVLKQARSEHTDVVALSAIAEGADTLFAETALGLDIPLEIVRPFDDYAADFETKDARERYAELRAAARTESKLAHRERSDTAYGAAMSWIVTSSDVVVIAWDGLPADGPGGTGSAVELVIKLNRLWLHLDVSDLSVKLYRGSQRREG